jgi:hypothetical protein
VDDGGTEAGAGASDAGDAGTDASTTGGPCADVNRERCDDINLAIPTNGSVIATRFRAAIGDDPARVVDLAFATTTEPLPEGQYAVRPDGQPGLCELQQEASGSGSVSASASASTDDAAGTCRQTAARTRSFTNVNLGPLVMLLVAARAVAAIMRRARR